MNLEGALTWAFEFEDQPYFAGFRSLATNGIDKPVLNVFRMFSQDERPAARRRERRRACRSTRSCEDGVRDQPDVAALASLDENKLCVLVWHYHDDDVPGPAADVELSLSTACPSREAARGSQHFRIDDDHSNAYTAWQRMGSPRSRPRSSTRELERAGQLTAMQASGDTSTSPTRAATVQFTLPRQAVSLLVIEW